MTKDLETNDWKGKCGKIVKKGQQNNPLKKGGEEAKKEK